MKQVDGNLDQMDALTVQAEKVANAFVEEVGKQKTAFVAPHMKSHTVMNDLNEIKKQMQQESNKAQAVYKKLNKN